MQQPKTPAGETESNKKKPRTPTPEEILAFYESQGLDHHAASLKAIEDLQSALLRRAADPRRKQLAPAGELRRKIDNTNTRLAVLDMKLDSKPGYLESLAIGVASGAILHGVAAGVRAIGDTWRSVASATKTGSPPY